MKNQTLADLLVKLTIAKAKKEGRHPMQIIKELKELIENKRKMERFRNLQAVYNVICKN